MLRILSALPARAAIDDGDEPASDVHRVAPAQVGANGDDDDDDAAQNAGFSLGWSRTLTSLGAGVGTVQAASWHRTACLALAVQLVPPGRRPQLRCVRRM